MLLPGKNCPRILPFLMVLIACVVASVEDSDSQKIDIKLGFDLTQGSNGVPILRIRDFQDSPEVQQRTGKQVKDSKRTLSSSDSSSSGSDEDVRSVKKRPEPVAVKKPKEVRSDTSSNGNDDDDSDGGDGLRSKVSTRGIPTDELNIGEDRRRRRRRHAKFGPAE